MITTQKDGRRTFITAAELQRYVIVRLQIYRAGFAAWLLAKQPGWAIRAGALPYLLKKEHGPGEHIGRDKVRRFFRKLEAAGYVSRRPTRKADGQWRWQIEFTETPPTTPTHAGTVDGSTVDGSAAGGTAVDGSGNTEWKPIFSTACLV